METKITKLAYDKLAEERAREEENRLYRYAKEFVKQNNVEDNNKVFEMCYMMGFNK